MARRRFVLIAGGFFALIFVLFGLSAQRLSSRRSALAPSPQPTIAAEQPRPTPQLPAPEGQGAQVAPTQAPPPTPEVVTPSAPEAAPFFDDRRFVYEPNFYPAQIQAFLESHPGPLKRLSFHVGDRQHTFAEVLSGQTSYYSVNPRVILALLELQNQLLSSADPSADQIGWAIGYRGENGSKRGLTAQVRWAVRQIVLAKRDYSQYAPLVYADNASLPPPPGLSFPAYALARVLAPTTTPDQLPALLQSFLATYIRLFDDPRLPPADAPPPVEAFLSRPMERVARVTSFFDHDAPYLSRNGSILTYWGRAETDIAFAYDGHDGWDYALAPPDQALAAADGEVVFAGNADDNCETRAVIVDHGNGYRTLYWHLARVGVEIGQQVARGQPIGVIGESGCAFGPHLHFGVQYLGRNVDPYGWCAATPDPWAQHPAGSASKWLWIDRPSPCERPPEGAVVVDSDSPGFSMGGDGWQPVPVGYSGSALFVPSIRSAAERRPWELRPLTLPAVAIWRPQLPAAGRYRVLAYVPYALSGLEDATRVRYRIAYDGGEAEVEVDGQHYANDWVDLGTYVFSPDSNPSVAISNLVEAEDRSVWADAVIWLPVHE